MPRAGGVWRLGQHVSLTVSLWVGRRASGGAIVAGRWAGSGRTDTGYQAAGSRIEVVVVVVVPALCLNVYSHSLSVDITMVSLIAASAAPADSLSFLY